MKRTESESQREDFSISTRGYMTNFLKFQDKSVNVVVRWILQCTPSLT